MPRVLDLRSDTVTQPTPAMRDAMARAEVGDDCYHDDPTVRRLEERVAVLLGKPSAVFLPSGTMANQLAVHVHCRPGETLACAPGAHVQVHEDASAARISGVQIMPIGDPAGFGTGQLEALVREESCGWPRVGLVWLENTLGTAGGSIWPLPQLRALAELARRHGRSIHLDGARLWNAHIASSAALPDLAACADTVSVSLSKGLGAPAGSVLAGETETVVRVRALRHALGGSMRQAGILAAAGLYALEHHVERLAEDHARARRLAHAISDLACWRARTPETNIVLCDLAPPWEAAEALCRPLRDAGVLCYPNLYREVRFVLHLGIDDEALEEVVARVRAVCGVAAPALTS